MTNLTLNDMIVVKEQLSPERRRSGKMLLRESSATFGRPRRYEDICMNGLLRSDAQT